MRVDRASTGGEAGDSECEGTLNRVTRLVDVGRPDMEAADATGDATGRVIGRLDVAAEGDAAAAGGGLVPPGFSVRIFKK